MVKPEIMRVIELEAKRNGLDFGPFRRMLMNIAVEDQAAGDHNDNEAMKLTEVYQEEAVLSSPSPPGRPPSPRQSWKCPNCNVSCSSASQLICHLASEHMNRKESEMEAKVCAVRCPECVNMYVDSIESLLHHFDAAHGSRTRFFNDFKTKEQWSRLIVQVNKRHISVIRAAYTDCVQSSPYKLLCDEYDLMKENNQLLLLQDEGPPLPEELVPFVESAKPGQKFDLDVPFGCPACAQCISSIPELESHMAKHSSDAYNRWRYSRIDALKSEMQWKILFYKSAKGLRSHSLLKPLTEHHNNCTSIAPTAYRNSEAHRLSCSPSVASSNELLASSPVIDAKLQAQPPMKLPVVTQAPMFVCGGGAQRATLTTSTDSNHSSNVVSAPMQPTHEVRRTKRRDLVATNRNARPKPLTAEKILSLSCMQCGLVFENRCKLTRHQLDHKMETNPYRCPVKGCMMSYDNRHKLKSHTNRKHPELPDAVLEGACEKGDVLMDSRGVNLHNEPQPLLSSTGTVLTVPVRPTFNSSEEAFVKEEPEEQNADNGGQSNDCITDGDVVQAVDLFVSNGDGIHVKSEPIDHDEEKEPSVDDLPDTTRSGRRRKARSAFSPHR